MEKKSLDISHNAINFLNSLTYQYLQDIGIEDRVGIILWEKNFIGKHQLMKVVQEKANQMSSQVKYFKTTCQKLFDDGLPSFWDDE